MNPYARHASNPAAMVGSLFRNWQLILQMTKRDVITRYRGSLIGLAWSFFNPLLMLMVYTFVFSTIFNARWGVEQENSRAGFAAILFVGVIVHGFLAECIIKAPGLILNNVSYVKRVVFPLEILPWIAVGSALFHAAVSFVVLLMAQLLLGHGIHATALYLPLVILPLLMVAVGFGWIIASLSVYVRDIGMITGVFATALMFLSPVFYPLSSLPKEFHWLAMINPLTFMIEESRKVLIFSMSPDWAGLGLYTLAALLFAWLGFWCFQRARNGFADVI